MRIEEIRNQIEKLERTSFMIQMSDRLDYDDYKVLENNDKTITILKNQLLEVA